MRVRSPRPRRGRAEQHGVQRAVRCSPITVSTHRCLGPRRGSLSAATTAIPSIIIDRRDPDPRAERRVPPVNVGDTFTGAPPGPGRLPRSAASSSQPTQLGTTTTTACRREGHPQAARPAVRRDVQRREPRPDRPDTPSSTRWPRASSPTCRAGHPRARGDPGQQRRHRRRRRRGRPDDRQFTAAITAAGGPTLRCRSIDPVNDAGRRRARRQHPRRCSCSAPTAGTFVDRPGGDVDHAGRPSSTAADGTAPLSVSPGRIDPTNDGLVRQSQAARRRVHLRRQDVFVVANHFNSKGGDDPLFGPLPAAEPLVRRSSASSRPPRCTTSSSSISATTRRQRRRARRPQRLRLLRRPSTSSPSDGARSST